MFDKYCKLDYEEKTEKYGSDSNGIFDDETLASFYQIFIGDIETKPDIEKNLLLLQEDYLKTRNYKYLEKISNILVPYLESLVKKRLIGIGYIDEDELHYKCSLGVYSFLVQFLKKKDFIIGTSFAGMMQFKIMEILKKDEVTEDDKTYSLNYMYTIKNNNVSELQDTLSEEDGLFYQEKKDKDVYYEEIEKLIYGVYNNKILSSKEKFLIINFIELLTKNVLKASLEDYKNKICTNFNTKTLVNYVEKQYVSILKKCKNIV